MESLNFGLFIADEKLYAYAASSAKLLPPKNDCDGRSAGAGDPCDSDRQA